MKLKIKNNIYITVALFFIVALALVLLLILPLFSAVEKSYLQLVSYKGAISSAQNEAMGLEKFNQDYKDFQPNLEKMDGLFVDAGSPIEFIQFIEQTLASSGMSAQISMVQNKQSPDRRGMPFVVFQINSNGTLARISELLTKFETSHYLMEIQAINMKEAKTQGKAQLSVYYDTSLSVKVYAK